MSICSEYIGQSVLLTYAVLGGVTSVAAVQLKRKKGNWDVPIGVQLYGDITGQ